VFILYLFDYVFTHLFTYLLMQLPHTDVVGGCMLA